MHACMHACALTSIAVSKCMYTCVTDVGIVHECLPPGFSRASGAPRACASRAHMSVCPYVRMSVCLYVLMSVSLYVCISVSPLLCVSVSLCLCVSVSLCLCVEIESSTRTDRPPASKDIFSPVGSTRRNSYPCFAQ